jgi:hypothetical protein
MIGSGPAGSRGASDACGSTAKVIRVIYIDGVPHLLCSEEMGWFNNIRREVTFATRIASASMLRRVRSELSAGDAIEIDAVDGHAGMILRDFRVQSGGHDEQELPVSVWPSATRRLDALLQSAGTAAQAPPMATRSRQISEVRWNRIVSNASECKQGQRTIVGHDSEARWARATLTLSQCRSCARRPPAYNRGTLCRTPMLARSTCRLVW